jgi:hypothetical protein
LILSQTEFDFVTRKFGIFRGIFCRKTPLKKQVCGGQKRRLNYLKNSAPCHGQKRLGAKSERSRQFAKLRKLASRANI